MWWMAPLKSLVIDLWRGGRSGEPLPPPLACFREPPFGPLSLPPPLTSSSNNGKRFKLLLLWSHSPFLEWSEVSWADSLWAITNVQRGHPPKKSSPFWGRSQQLSQSSHSAPQMAEEFWSPCLFILTFRWWLWQGPLWLGKFPAWSLDWNHNVWNKLQWFYFPPSLNFVGGRKLCFFLELSYLWRVCLMETTTNCFMFTISVLFQSLHLLQHPPSLWHLTKHTCFIFKIKIYSVCNKNI